MKCRHCSTNLVHTFLDLGFAPPSNAYITEQALNKQEAHFPLRVMVCENCWLVQTVDFARAEQLFAEDYAYFSSTSTGWLSHAKQYAQRMIEELDLTAENLVIEVASNDGYLLKNFVQAGVPCLGIEPTDSTANASELLGIPVIREFFGEELGERLRETGRAADLIAGNNVYAHVPDINDFTRGLKAALKQGGMLTLEFPHLLQLIQQKQFDTVYHEHFSYLSLYTVSQIFLEAGLKVLDVEELPTHGGSLRVFGVHCEDPRMPTESVEELISREKLAGLQDLGTYLAFQPLAERVKDDLLLFLLEQKRRGKKVVAYGAAAKGNTLLNFAGVKPDLLPFVCDAALAKQGKYMPGSHIPILAPSQLSEFQFDFLLILPWNIADEVKKENNSLRAHGVQFVTAVPELKIS